MFVRIALVSLAKAFIVQFGVPLQVVRGLLWVADIEQLRLIRERHTTHGVSECLLFRSIDEADKVIFLHLKYSIV